MARHLRRKERISPPTPVIPAKAGIQARCESGNPGTVRKRESSTYFLIRRQGLDSRFRGNDKNSSGMRRAVREHAAARTRQGSAALPLPYTDFRAKSSS